VRTARREHQAVRWRREVAPVRNGCHFERTLGAIEEGVEHLGVEVSSFELLFREAIVVPDGVRRRVVVLGEVLGSFPGTNDIATRGSAGGEQVMGIAS
jgi:hypothetical protein